MTIQKHPITLSKKIVNKSHQVMKSLYQQFILKNKGLNVIVSIVGCQRSGTGMLLNVFNKDFRTIVFGEGDKRVTNGRLRLKPYHEVNNVIKRYRAPIAIIKPLVESQNIIQLLDYFRGSKAIYMYRNFRDVANSSIKKWGLDNGKNNLMPIINNVKGNWRSEYVPLKSREVINKYYYDKIDPYDAALLFWYIRNMLYFDLELYKRPDIILCKYEDLVTNPENTLKKIYKFIGYQYPYRNITKDVKSSQIGSTKEIDNNSIESLCENLLEKFDKILASVK